MGLIITIMTLPLLDQKPSSIRRSRLPCLLVYQSGSDSFLRATMSARVEVGMPRCVTLLSLILTHSLHSSRMSRAVHPHSDAKVSDGLFNKVYMVLLISHIMTNLE